VEEGRGRSLASRRGGQVFGTARARRRRKVDLPKLGDVRCESEEARRKKGYESSRGDAEENEEDGGGSGGSSAEPMSDEGRGSAEVLLSGE
jgi:hypothetical protein